MAAGGVDGVLSLSMTVLELRHDTLRGERLKAMPVVVLSSSSETVDLTECYRHGVNGYVVKAVDYQGFMTSVRQIGAFWGKLNETVPFLIEAQA